MLTYIYDISKGVQMALNISTLAGTVIGQLGFGILADVYGRKRMYGLELLIIIVSTVGVAMSSEGAAGSMSLIGWLIAWRFFLGIGIGGDYPLSAVITSEFAPTKNRGRMLAAVVFMQPCGYLIATVVSIIALEAYKSDMPSISGTANCQSNDACRRAVDSVWRWIVGFGAVPAAIAIFSRFTLPESPRYTIEVLNRPDEAWEDVNEIQDNFSGSWEDTEIQIVSDENHPIADEVHISPSPDPSMARLSPNFTGNGLLLPDNAISASSTAVANNDPISGSSLYPPVMTRDSDGSSEAEQRGSWSIYYSRLKEYFITKGYWLTLFGTSMTWAFFDFAFYIMGPNSVDVVKKVFNQPGPSEEKNVYTDLMENSWHTLIIVSIGSMLGGAGMIFLIGRFSPRTLQLFGFTILTALFITVGLIFEFMTSTSRVPLLVFLYIISMIFFEIGPNYTTYIIPAELFPTNVRCTGHGVSAAAGKLAAILIQFFAQYAPIGPYHDSDGDTGVKWFGFAIIIFAGFMVIGAVLTQLLTPETRKKDGSNRPLEELEYVGKHWGMEDEICFHHTSSENNPENRTIHALLLPFSFLYHCFRCLGHPSHNVEEEQHEPKQEEHHGNTSGYEMRTTPMSNTTTNVGYQ